MGKVLGLVNLHRSSDLGPLTHKRSLASTGFLGRYSFIDFPLSNLANSGIDEVGILIKDNPRSLFRHLRLGDKEWSLNTKSGGIFLMYNEQYAGKTAYNHDINNMIENDWFLRGSSADTIVIAPINLIYRIDYRDVIKAHNESGADISVVYKHVDDAKTNFIGQDYLTFDELDTNRVVGYNDNKGSEDNRAICLESYVMSKEMLFKLIQTAQNRSSFFSLRDVIVYLVKKLNIQGYEYKGYLRAINNIQDYMKVSLELLDNNVRVEAFGNNIDWPVYTRTYDTPPARYGVNACVNNSYVANGSTIKGTVKNSIIGRDVLIEEGAVVENSIILSHVKISKNAHLNYTVIDKEATIKVMKNLKGTLDDPLVIKKQDIV